MGMDKNTRVDVLNRPGIMLPPGYQKNTISDQEKVTELAPGSVEELLKKIESANGLKEGTIPRPEEISDDRKVEIKSQEEEMKTLYEKYEETKSDSFGWVQKNEVEIAKKRIKECLGFDPPHMVGYSMAVVIHEEKFASIDGKKSIIYRGDSSVTEDKYRNCVGLVVAQGSECYDGKRFKENILLRISRLFFNKWMPPVKRKPWCRVGDWIVFPRHEGTLVNYRGAPLMMLHDFKFWAVVEKPEYVSRF